MKSSFRKLRSALTLLACVAAPFSAHALPVSYQLILDATRVDNGSCSSSFALHQFGCLNVNDRYMGSFTVDDSLLAVNGINRSTPISNFVLKIGNVEWAQNYPSDLAGFRTGLGFAAAPGFFDR